MSEGFFSPTLFDYSSLTSENFIVLSIGAILLLVAALFALTRPFHNMQQNFYLVGEYVQWCITAPKGRAVGAFLMFCLTAFTLCFEWLSFYPFLALSAIICFFKVFSAIRSQKKAIKPIVFTRRMWRMYAIALVLILGLIALMFLYHKAVVTVLFIATILIFTVPLFAVIVMFINMPIQKAINGGYIHSAKKILKTMPNMKIIGVTGSYGKTSTKFILGRILSEKYEVTVTPENFNTTLGVVRTIRESMNPRSEIFVCEMGAKYVGEIKEICDLVHPDMGIITSIGPQHLISFRSIENIIKTKFELADAVFAKGGTMFLNQDNKYIDEHSKTKNGDMVFFGTDNGDCHITRYTMGPAGLDFDVWYKGETITLTTRLLGKYNMSNIAGAVAIAKSLGVSNEQIRYAVSRLEPTEHRLELKRFGGGALLIDDSYNSNPTGCLGAVEVLSSFEGYKKVIITPGLVELGEKEYECNFNLGKAAAPVADIIYFVGGDHAKPLVDGANDAGVDQEKMHVVNAFKEALADVTPHLDSKTVVLIENDLPDFYL